MKLREGKVAAVLVAGGQDTLMKRSVLSAPWMESLLWLNTSIWMIQ